MALYSEKVMDHFQHPRNVGVIEDANGVGEVGNAKCGDIMKIYLKIEDDIIKDVKFETFGCGSAIASSSMATAWINFARYGSPETPSLPNWPACTPGDEATMIFDRTCEIRRNFDHELVKKLVETEYNPMTPVVEDEEEDAFFIH